MEIKKLTILLIVGFAGSTAVRLEIPCNFIDSYRGYTCRLPGKTVGDNEYEIVGGEHLPRESDDSVVAFSSINNHFRNFPTLSRFANLRHIEVTGSMIRRLEAADLGSRSALQTLILDNNEIDSFDEAAFAGVPNLRQLFVRYNRIRNLVPAVFQPAVSLGNLDLSHNLIERLSDATVFSRNTRLVSLEFASNKIEFINREIFNGLSVLNLFDVSSNICSNESFFGIRDTNERNQMMDRLKPCFEGTTNA
jgi:Leucine-rich repeat (LRR) protein